MATPAWVARRTLWRVGVRDGESQWREKLCLSCRSHVTSRSLLGTVQRQTEWWSEATLVWGNKGVFLCCMMTRAGWEMSGGVQRGKDWAKKVLNKLHQSFSRVTPCTSATFDIVYIYFVFVYLVSMFVCVCVVWLRSLIEEVKRNNVKKGEKVKKKRKSVNCITEKWKRKREIKYNLHTRFTICVCKYKKQLPCRKDLPFVYHPFLPHFLMCMMKVYIHPYSSKSWKNESVISLSKGFWKMEFFFQITRHICWIIIYLCMKGYSFISLQGVDGRRFPLKVPVTFYISPENGNNMYARQKQKPNASHRIWWRLWHEYVTWHEYVAHKDLLCSASRTREKTSQRRIISYVRARASDSNKYLGFSSLVRLTGSCCGSLGSLPSSGFSSFSWRQTCLLLIVYNLQVRSAPPEGAVVCGGDLQAPYCGIW